MGLSITILCQYTECCYAECFYAEYCYAECCYAGCRYAQCRYAECRGVHILLKFTSLKFFIAQPPGHGYT